MENTYTEESFPIHYRIDSTCVLDKGVICNRYPNGQIDALPISSSQIFRSTHLVLFFYFMF